MARRRPGRLKQVIFLTDAAVGNEAELFDDIARRLGDARLFTIGIGTAPNSYFMRKAAELGRGSFTYIGDVTEVGERMTDLLHKLEQPAITDIAVRWPDRLASERGDVSGDRARHLRRRAGDVRRPAAGGEARSVERPAGD
jgi:Ca-activated chloride channel family protein